MEADEGEVEGSDLSSLMERFSQDERVKRALAEGVDLREYARRVESELGAAERDAVLVRALVFPCFFHDGGDRTTRDRPRRLRRCTGRFGTATGFWSRWSGC